MENGWRRALAYLPPRLADAAERCGTGRIVSEIRLRAGGLCTLTADGGNLSTGILCLPGEIEETVSKLTGGSLYAEADNIRGGVITAGGGIRAGVCGRAVAEDGRITAVRDITSVNLRIPRRIPGAADALVPFGRAGKSILIYSPPGRGKTTVLRELCVRLASREGGMRIAVIAFCSIKTSAVVFQAHYTTSCPDCKRKRLRPDRPCFAPFCSVTRKIVKKRKRNFRKVRM